MRSDEIKQAADDARTESGWLREIAFQLARLNERLRESSEEMPKRTRR